MVMNCAVTFLSWAFAATMFQAGTPSAAGRPVIDNERVAVWQIGPDDPARPASTVAADSVEISLDQPPGAVLFLKKGSRRTSTRTPGSMVVVELKDHPAGSVANTSGYPNAFPRPRSRRVFENDRIIVWDYSWNAGEPTPMHFHDKDVVVVYLQDGALRSTTPKGEVVVNDYPRGSIRFNKGDRSHTEELAKGSQRAIIVELK
jgi:hypothetical protein